MMTTMFSEEDMKEILRLFPPSRSDSGSLPSLVPSASGHGLITLSQLQDEFLRCVTTETQRIPIATLALDLDVDQDVVLQLARTKPTVVLFSRDSRVIVTESERHSIRDELRNLMALGFVPKVQYLEYSDIDTESLNSILTDVTDGLIDNGDYVCSIRYKHRLSETLEEKLTRSLREMQPVDITPSDFAPKDTEKPASIKFKTPSLSFVHDLVLDVLKSPDLADKFYFLERTESLCYTPKQLLEQQGDTVVSDLKSGVLPFVDMSRFRDEFIYITPRHVSQYFEDSPDVEVIDSYAISRVWASTLGEECRQALDRDGFVNLQQHLAIFPNNTQDHVLEQVEQLIINFARNPNTDLHRVAEYWLTEAGYTHHRDTLLSHAAANAQSQWQELSDNPEKEIKFNPSNMIPPSTTNNIAPPILQALSQEKPTEKALESHFWATISTHQTQTDAAFAAFWTDRVQSRTQIHTSSLPAIRDPKLLAQLTTLLTSYLQTDLLPDAISKAHSQRLLLSPKTRKNMQKLSAQLSPAGGTTPDLPSTLSALQKFHTKQSLAAPSPASLQAAKETLLLDMRRRMQKQKQKKPSDDDAVLFLTLVVVLCARYYPGVVYVTGRFAPKLLRELKGVLDPGVYARLEGWKEGAKMGLLSGGDREEMQRMAEG